MEKAASEVADNRVARFNPFLRFLFSHSTPKHVFSCQERARKRGSKRIYMVKYSINFDKKQYCDGKNIVISQAFHKTSSKKCRIVPKAALLSSGICLRGVCRNKEVGG